MNIERRRLFRIEKNGQVGEGGVQCVARRRREHRQRIFSAERRVACRRFSWRNKSRQRIEALVRQRLRIKLALSRRRREVSVGERRERGGHVQALPALFLERVPGNALRTRVIRQERVARHLLVAFAEARLVEAPARGETSEYFGIGLC